MSSSSVTFSSRSWPLQRYARCVGVSPTRIDDSYAGSNPAAGGNSHMEWKVFEHSELTLLLLGSKDIIIHCGNVIHENYCLRNAAEWMRGINKGDSILFACRINNEIRRFRVQFKMTDQKSSIENCKDCASLLLELFSIKNATKMKNLPAKQSNKEEKQLEGEVAIKDVAQAICHKTSPQLPIAYQVHSQDIDQQQISLFLNLCLSDANFPAFVDSVEKELQQIIKNE
ncbi:meiotic recombination protein REC114-like [Saccoglossus kowalevskii]|uniref:Meiotic recombination protein REC114-like n=1 Tax=Saccoglossus kowalevskii TaxID=10224 RepID=A0ABM0MYN7_SACKO|nr:PREDICTED: meiotic recombination protein REC114-like [Saccoglossus kowalevskii]